MGGMVIFMQSTGFGLFPFSLSFIVLGASADFWFLYRQCPRLLRGLSSFAFSILCILYSDAMETRVQTEYQYDIKTQQIGGLCLEIYRQRDQDEFLFWKMKCNPYVEGTVFHSIQNECDGDVVLNSIRIPQAVSWEGQILPQASGLLVPKSSPVLPRTLISLLLFQFFLFIRVQETRITWFRCG